MSLGHSDRAHAFLGASSAKQWLNCTPSMKASSHIPSTTSTFAEEGTFAHELSELFFAREFQNMHGRTFNAKYKKMKENEYYSTELEDYVKEYVDYVAERINVAKARDEATLILLFEERLDLSDYVPESFGTGDVIVSSGGKLEIIDLKFGKGVEVSAIDNPQLRLYGLGAVELVGLLQDIDEVTMTIHQPRLNNISSESMALDDLVKWGTEYVKPRAEMAFKGEGEYVPGEHCRFCKIKAKCRARAEANLKAVADMKDPNLMSDEEISDLLFKVDDIQKWAKDVQTYALYQAQDGKEFEGWKLVAGRSTRKITDPDEAKDIFSVLFDEDQFMKPRELKSITNLEKEIGKKKVAELIGDLIIKPEGIATLVPESDKRPALNDPASEFDEIKEDK